jgi:hypothetical protein
MVLHLAVQMMLCFAQTMLPFGQMMLCFAQTMLPFGQMMLRFAQTEGAYMAERLRRNP